MGPRQSPCTACLELQTGWSAYDLERIRVTFTTMWCNDLMTSLIKAKQKSQNKLASILLIGGWLPRGSIKVRNMKSAFVVLLFLASLVALARIRMFSSPQFQHAQLNRFVRKISHRFWIWYLAIWVLVEEPRQLITHTKIESTIWLPCKSHPVT